MALALMAGAGSGAASSSTAKPSSASKEGNPGGGGIEHNLCILRTSIALSAIVWWSMIFKIGAETASASFVIWKAFGVMIYNPQNNLMLWETFQSLGQWISGVIPLWHWELYNFLNILLTTSLFIMLLLMFLLKPLTHTKIGFHYSTVYWHVLFATSSWQCPANSTRGEKGTTEDGQQKGQLFNGSGAITAVAGVVQVSMFFQ